jgi:hypothetical protein
MHSEVLRKALLTACIALPLIPCKTLAQESEQTITLIAQNQRRQVSFIAGQFISYKTLVSKNFKNGRLTEITDSMVSLEHKDHKIEKVFLKELTAFKLKGTDALIDLKRPMTGYNLDKVSIKLISGKKISGKLISTKSDSLVMQVQGKKPSIKKGYAEIESVGLHKRGSGGIGALIGGILGGGIGALIGVASRPSDDPTGLGGPFRASRSNLGVSCWHPYRCCCRVIQQTISYPRG